MVKATKLYFKYLFKIQGRATRPEYWWMQLELVIFYGLIELFSWNYLGGSFWDSDNFPIRELQSALETSLYISMCILIFVVNITFILLAIRRLHDINKKGWNILWVFLPIIGAIYLFNLFIRASDLHRNEYGEYEFFSDK